MKKMLLVLLAITLFGNIYSQSSKCLSGNCADGFGIYQWASGDKYIGDWKNSLMDGYGTCKWANGDVFSGEWKNNERDGQGIYTFTDGSKKSGVWRNSVFQTESVITGCSGNCTDGYGTYIWAYDTKWAGDKYIGNWKEGYLSGQGTYYWSSGSRYVGEWKANKRDGYGTYYYADGTIEKGTWQGNEFITADNNNTTITNNNNNSTITNNTNITSESKCMVGDCNDGFGVYFWKAGDKYFGEWKSGLMDGYGTYKWSNGDKYTGEWKKNKKNGQGIYIYADGSKKSGTWDDGVYQSQGAAIGCIKGNCDDGYGTYVWGYDSKWAGDKYIGYWKGGKISGRGKYFWSSGSYYDGEWSDNMKNGQGVAFYTTGTKDDGTFKDDNFVGISSANNNSGGVSKCMAGNCDNGFGTYFWKEGDKYFGDWKGGVMDGYGTYKWSNGDKYSGEWKNNKKDGQGIYIYADGSKKNGTWVGGVYQSETVRTGCISGDCDNGYGTYVWAYDSQWAGDKYIGYWKGGSISGHGKYYWSTGSCYEGEWANNQRNGQGINYYTDGTKDEGAFSNDKFSGTSNYNTTTTYTESCLSGDCVNGYGVYQFKSGEKYEGYWKNDKRNGYGTNHYKNGDTYIGNWLDDQQYGAGTYTYTNGDKYTGEYKFHKRDGYGTYTFVNGNKYVGNFKENKYDGQGTMYYANGTTKSGNWKDDIFQGENTNNYNTSSTGCVSGDCKNGYGVYVFASGEKYEGYWQNEMRNGQGTNYFSSKAKFVGTFKDDKKSGFGTYTYKPESLYESYIGYFENDKMTGQGTLLFRSGQKYIGSFKDDLYNGEGTMYLTNGSTQSGIWKDDQFVGKSDNSYGCVTGDCSNGFGTYIYQNGAKYVGDWQNGLCVKGTYFYSNGDKYIGDFKGNKKEGSGTFTFAIDNKKYIGQWVNDLYEGQGTMYFSDGTKKTGLWKAGEFLGENTITNKPPFITWLTPEYYTSTVTTQTTPIKACIKSSSTLSSIKVFVNNVEQLNEARGYNVVSTSDCDFTLDKSVNLSKGDNQIKIVATNQSGSTTSEIRTIKLDITLTPQQNRIALVIGNSNYISSPLRNPANDAKAIADELQKLGFAVTLLTNLGQDDMKKAIRNFGEKLSSKKGVGLFYFAGHGIQMNGENYLIPVDAKIEKEQDVEFEAVNLKRIMGEMDYAQNDMNIVILDACRNNPFARSFRSSGNNGLATTTAPKGTFIAYATAPGSVAADGSGNNGLYTQELLKALQNRGKLIEDVFKTVRNSVYEKSNKQQVPWENSSIFSDFIFNQ